MALAGLLSIAFAVAAAAHEVQPAVSDVEIDAQSVTISLTTAVEPLISGIDLATVADTDDSPLAALNDRLRALPPAELERALTEAWPGIAARITLRAGDTDLAPELTAIRVPATGDVELRRDSTVVLTAALPGDDTPVVFGWDASLGGLIVRQVTAGGDGYSDYLTAGALSEPLPRTGAAEETLGAVAVRYVVSGFDHIIPKGLDHILFVLGLYFYALAWRPLLWQVTAFTAAHTVTLALAATGMVTIPGSIVEPLIALSIAFVALENIWSKGRKTITWSRVAIVFGFGLLHGLGFASVLADFGLGDNFAAKLIAFNVGVELGQLAVISAAFLLFGLPFGSRPFYRPAIAIPASVVIATIACYWFLNRVGMLGDIPYLT